MVESNLEHTLRLMVRRYGFEEVSRCLREMEIADHLSGRSGQARRKKTSSDSAPAARFKKKRSGTITAPEYAAKMDVSPEKGALLAELAIRFDDKSFLPAFGDVRNFCQIYRIDEPASRSRASAIPRIFKFMAAMETDDLRRVLDKRTFAGPSRLAPIADAIRNRAGRRGAVRPPESRSPSPSSSPPVMEAVSSSNSPGEGT